MESKKNAEHEHTTIWISKAVKDRLQKIKGRGLSWDRFLNEQIPPERKEVSKNEKQKTGDDDKSLR